MERCGDGRFADPAFFGFSEEEKSKEMRPRCTSRHSPSWIEVKPYVFSLQVNDRRKGKDHQYLIILQDLQYWLQGSSALNSERG